MTTKTEKTDTTAATGKTLPQYEHLQVARAASVPAVMVGEPGTGKTAVMNALIEQRREVCDAEGRLFASIELELNKMEPQDLLGYPDVRDGLTHMTPLASAVPLAECEEGIIAMDELGTAQNATFKAALKVLHERIFGGFRLGMKVWPMCAMNPPSSGVAGQDLPAPIANRLTHIKWELPQGTVAMGLLGHWPELSPLRVDPEWEKHLVSYAAIVSAFLTRKPEFENSCPTGQAASGPWPSGRSWENVVRMLAASHDSGISEEGIGNIVCGTVGDGAGMEFLEWWVERDLPDPEAILADPENGVIPDREDSIQSVVSAVGGAVLSNCTSERWTAGLVYFAKIANETGRHESAAFGVRLIAGAQPSEDSVIPDGVEVLAPLLLECGLDV